jgi:hypothetical protein
VPGLPRSQTFKRQLSESREHLAPVEPSAEERRAASVDRRCHYPQKAGRRSLRAHPEPRSSAPSFYGETLHETGSNYAQSLPVDLADLADIEAAGSTYSDLPHAISTDMDGNEADDEYTAQDAVSVADSRSLTASQYEAMIHDELEREWILNLSMHFRDRSKREKFFVTYREQEHMWRRVTVSLDYRDAPENSLEWDLNHTKYQRDKSAKIYEAIRESLPDIQFYDTVTNLKLETTDGRLHVHVVEDGNVSSRSEAFHGVVTWTNRTRKSSTIQTSARFAISAAGESRNETSFSTPTCLALSTRSACRATCSSRRRFPVPTPSRSSSTR